MHDGAITAPSRHLSVTENIALPPITKGNANAKSFRSIVFPWQSYKRASVLCGLRISDDPFAS